MNSKYAISCVGIVFGVVAMLQAQDGERVNEFKGPVRIVELLWESNPQSAANTLRSMLQTAVNRKQLDSAKVALNPLAEKTDVLLKSFEKALKAGMQADSAFSDARLTVALATQILLSGSKSGLVDLTEVHIEQLEQQDSATLLLSIWLATDPDRAMQFVARALPGAEPKLASSLIAASTDFDRSAAGKLLLDIWAELPNETRLLAIEPLTRGQQTMSWLVDAVVQGRVKSDLVNANQLRKWVDATGTPSREQSLLREHIEKVWGKIRSEDNMERQAVVERYLRLLNSVESKGSVAGGEVVFTRVCSQCHILHGRGYEVGPKITANGRGSLQQLVSNVFDPSLVIGEAFQAKTVLTADGEIVSGLVAAENDRYLTLKIQGGKLVEFDKQLEIEQVKQSSKSLMPEGLEAQMTEQEVLDLFAYLCLLKPLGTEDNELIPGTPPTLVQP